MKQRLSNGFLPWCRGPYPVGSCLKQLRAERGTATAETALMLMVVMLMVALLLGVGSIGIKQLRLNEATRTVAREIMRGEDPAAAITSGKQVAGSPSSFEISMSGEWATVKGTAQAGLFTGGGWLSHSFNLNATFSVRLEPHLIGAEDGFESG